MASLHFLFLHAMTAFKNFINRLQESLEQNLPGDSSQLQMAPVTRLIELKRKQAEKPPRKSAVLVLFYPENKQAKLILIKRAIDQTVHSGQISFPGGKVEKWDSGLKETALREAEEEIGLPQQDVTIIGELSKLYIPPSNFDVFPFVGFVSQLPKLKGNHEVQHILKVDYAELRSPSSRTEKMISHRLGKQVMVPSYAVNNEDIWGATAMILSELIEITREF